MTMNVGQKWPLGARKARVLGLGLCIGFWWALPTGEISGLQGNQSRDLTPAEILKREGRTVALVEMFDANDQLSGQASGVVVQADGVVATNHHVLEGACSIRVSVAGVGKRMPVVSLVGFNPKGDIALLKVSSEGLPVATLGRSGRLQVGDRIVAIGNPMGLEHTISEGIVSGIRVDENHRWLQITAPISPGSSGGGLYDSRGRLVGLTTFTVAESQSLNFAIPIEDVLTLLKANKDMSLEISWSVVSKWFCNHESEELDSALLIGILGLPISDPRVEAVLKGFNGGENARARRVRVQGMGDVLLYSLNTGVTVKVEDGRVRDIQLSGGADYATRVIPLFRGKLPYGLSWDMDRPSVLKYLGNPEWSSRTEDSSDGSILLWDRYYSGTIEYLIIWDADLKLNSIMIGLRE